jgi:hypothetical protein
MSGYQPIRHKKYIIADIVREKKEWCDKYNDVPIEYWQRRWKFLCDRLYNFGHMEHQLRHKSYHKKEKE